ncbi:MAG: beta-N-acetylhexosaminidase [Desulfomonilaceae bacterium]
MDAQEIGNLFLVGFNGTALTSEVRGLIDDLNPSGVVLFSRNIVDPSQTAQLNHDLQRHARTQWGEGIFIGVDQEGGRVRRLREPFLAFPPALELATSQEPEEAVRDFARVTARETALVGFNLDFVPVLDVLGEDETDKSSVIGDRSYGPDPHTVWLLGKIVMESMRQGGIIPCGKHFPGHGGTSVDSHKDLPVDDRLLQTLERHDLIPFRKAVAAQIEMMMTAHVVYQALDPHRPATLSPQVITGLLRGEMSYNGVVITDDLDMGAVAHHYSSDTCALNAFAAGVDLLLICNNPDKAFSARDRILRALKDGEISETRVNQSLERIRNLKARYAASMTPCDKKAVREYFVKDAV